MCGPQRNQVLTLLTVAGLLLSLPVSSIASRSDSVRAITFAPANPQCGHWAIMRCCESLGVPIEMQTILKLLPPKEAGASMLELKKVFTRIGLKPVGKRETLQGLIKGPFPAITHLGGNHFVTVSAADDEVVCFFDGGGRAGTMTCSRSGWEFSRPSCCRLYSCNIQCQNVDGYLSAVT